MPEPSFVRFLCRSLAVLDDELLDADELDEETLDELLAEERLDELLAELSPPIGSGEVGESEQPARPAASTAAGAPDSSSRKSRRFVRSVVSGSGAGASDESWSDMCPPMHSRPDRYDADRVAEAGLGDRKRA